MILLGEGGGKQLKISKRLLQRVGAYQDILFRKVSQVCRILGDSPNLHSFLPPGGGKFSFFLTLRHPSDVIDIQNYDYEVLELITRE